MSTSILASSASEHWNTPAEVVELVRRVGGGRIALDPCSNGWSVVGAEREYRAPEVDGLREPWVRDAAEGLVFVNPPYGRALAEWAPKIATEVKAGAQVCTLVFAKTDTVWWRRLAEVSDAIVFLPRRLRFTLRGEKLDAATYPSALLYSFRGHRGPAYRFASLVVERYPEALVHLGSWELHG